MKGFFVVVAAAAVDVAAEVADVFDLVAAPRSSDDLTICFGFDSLCWRSDWRLQLFVCSTIEFCSLPDSLSSRPTCFVDVWRPLLLASSFSATSLSCLRLRHVCPS